MEEIPAETCVAIRSTQILLNGEELKIVNDTTLPEFVPVTEKAGTVTLAPATVTFLIV